MVTTRAIDRFGRVDSHMQLFPLINLLHLRNDLCGIDQIRLLKNLG